MAKKSWQKSHTNDDVWYLLLTTVKEKLFKSNYLSRFQKDANQGKNKISFIFIPLAKLFNDRHSLMRNRMLIHRISFLLLWECTLVNPLSKILDLIKLSIYISSYSPISF